MNDIVTNIEWMDKDEELSMQSTALDYKIKNVDYKVRLRVLNADTSK